MGHAKSLKTKVGERYFPICDAIPTLQALRALRDSLDGAAAAVLFSIARYPPSLMTTRRWLLALLLLALIALVSWIYWALREIEKHEKHPHAPPAHAMMRNHLHFPGV